MSNETEEIAQGSAAQVLQVLAIIGDHWTLCVLHEAFHGVRRFADMRERLGIASNILSNRLARLVNHGILEQLPYKETGRRTRYEYQLTPKGLALLPALVALIEWGEHYIAPGDEKVIHVECGQEVTVAIECKLGHKIDNTLIEGKLALLKNQPS